ncbi:MAG: YabP/YqfC family sporulation protein [Firmicutes bacterium]|nr:YabP/YqfC family sporulation protein [Bacillota bacterium]
MSFFSEVAKTMGLDSLRIASGYQVINYNGEAAYVEGFVQVLSIDNNEIVLKLKKGKIVISGENLSVASLETGAIIVKGNIKEVKSER